MKRIGRVLLLSLLASGLLGGCSEREDSPLMAEPDGVGPANRERRSNGLISIDVPGALASAALDINDPGVIVGRYRGAEGATHGFVRLETGRFTTIDVPGAVFTVAAGINDRGDIVGQYAAEEDPDARHGFLLRTGKFTSFDPEGSGFTNALGINSRGDITGRFFRADEEVAHGYRLRREAFAVLDFPGAAATNLWRSNSLGVMVGGYIDADDRPLAFVVRGREFRTLPTPENATISMDNGDINSRGDVVGAYCDCDAVPASNHGFLLTRDGRFTPIDVPGAAATTAFGTNDRGDIVGFYTDAEGGNHGFLMPTVARKYGG